MRVYAPGKAKQQAMTLRELLEARQRVWTRQTELNLLAATENRALSDSEETEYQNLEAEFERLDGLIKRENQLADRAAQAEEDLARASESEGRATGGAETESGGEEASASERGEFGQRETRAAVRRYMAGGEEALTPRQAEIIDYRREAVNAFLRVGESSLTPAARSVIGPFQRLDDGARDGLVQALIADGMVEDRAQSVGTSTAGGNLVPDDAMRPLVEAQAAWGGMFDAGCDVLRTSTGREIPIPTDDDTGNSGALLSENTEVDEQDMTFGQKLVNAYTYTTKLIRVSRQLLEDSDTDVAGRIGRAFGRRLGTAQNAHLTTGDGSNKANGVVTASTAGKTAASASAITYLEMIDLKFSVDPAYRIGGRWMMHDSTFKAAKKLLDGDNRPIFQPDVQNGRIDRIDGDPFSINMDMAEITASAKVMLYGAFSNYVIRIVNGILMLRLEERFAEFNQVGFVGFQRIDGELIDAGTNPIKHYLMAAS